MKKQLLIILLVMFTFCANMFAQDRKVTGKVTSAEDGTGLPGVSVRVKNTNTGVQTDASGNYSIAVPDGASVKLQF
jgi:hypothetical protein